MGERLFNADPNTFEVFEQNDRYAKDIKYIYNR